MKRNKLLVLSVVLTLVMTILAACTGGQSNQQPTQGAQSGPQVGGSLVIGITGDPYNIATWLSNDLNASMVMNLAMPPLMATDDNGNKVPYIIEDYDISDDAKVYTVKIHDGLTWHDGKPFTTDDLAFTCEYVAKYKLGYGADMYGGVEKTEIVDKTTIKYYLKQPQVNFLSQIGFWVDVMPKHIYETVTDPMNFQFNGVGYGPYKLVDYKKGEYYSFERVPDWPLANDGKGAYIENVTFRIFPDANALILAMKNGEVQVSGSALPAAAQNQLESTPDKFGIMRVNSLGFGYISFNYKNELLKDINVRKAFAMTVDRDALVTTAMQGAAIKMETPVSPVYADLVKSQIKFPGFDVEGAKKALEAAGYTDKDNDGVRESSSGKKLEFELIYRTTTANADSIANVIKANAEQAGFKLNLKPVDPATYTDRVTQQKSYDINFIDWGVIDDPDSSLSTIYASNAALNFMGYKNDKIDQLLAASMKEPSFEERIKIMDEFQKEFVNELPTVNAWVRVNAYGFSKEYEGWDLTPGLYGVVDIKDLVKVYKK
ncbi:oligopeptide-binding protein AppA precursor [Oxobacter pfennigii]|uniref:Oligopeptide-binding protein AppA n=1 Tax=Oxobacter pfennigii TaxID=36849 RepID=A0A0P8Y792_9CLOT|nr:ABC transporter substrate-binding protein [Oxobacter pfennigii]KPU42338.1 oligopeptide-binding protein AppA precursor [Oxobacter pfennigii]